MSSEGQELSSADALHLLGGSRSPRPTTALRAAAKLWACHRPRWRCCRAERASPPASAKRPLGTRSCGRSTKTRSRRSSANLVFALAALPDGVAVATGRRRRRRSASRRRRILLRARVRRLRFFRPRWRRRRAETVSASGADDNLVGRSVGAAASTAESKGSGRTRTASCASTRARCRATAAGWRACRSLASSTDSGVRCFEFATRRIAEALAADCPTSRRPTARRRHRLRRPTSPRPGRWGDCCPTCCALRGATLDVANVGLRAVLGRRREA